eukprot:6176204-Pleurochrysis_carterae.AAC.1
MMWSRIGKNRRGGSGFLKRIRKIVGTANERDGDVEGLHAFAYEKMTAVDVLGPLMMFRIVGQIDGGLVVHSEGCWRAASETQIAEQGSEIYCCLGGLIGRHDFSFAGGEGDCSLLLR